MSARLSPLFDSQEIGHLVWRDRFRRPGEETLVDTFRRVAEAVYAKDSRRAEELAAGLAAMCDGSFCPGARILALAGPETAAGPPEPAAPRSVGHWLTIEDQPAGVLEPLEAAVAGFRQGAEVELDLTPLPAAGGRLGPGGAQASGVLPVLDLMEAMAQRALGAEGTWPGRIVATLACDHPDLPAFVAAKSESGRLERLELAVLISDAFMAAVEAEGDWELGHGVPPVDPGTQEIVHERATAEGGSGAWHVHQVVSAAALWEEVLRHCDGRGDASAIFLDRRGARPTQAGARRSGEGGPPAGLEPVWGPAARGAINLASLVAEPYGARARLEESKLRAVTATAVRFLDNAICALPCGAREEAAAALAERRIGLGVIGLGSLLQMLGLPYGSEAARQRIDSLMAILRDAAYQASASLAIERGAFPAFDPARCGDENLAALPELLRRSIRGRGLRNAGLLSLEAEDVCACLFGGVSPGIDPAPALRSDLEWQAGDAAPRRLRSYDHGFLDYCRQHGLDPDAAEPQALGPAWCTADSIDPETRLALQARLQAFCDGPVRSLIGLPAGSGLKDRQALFRRAHALGCRRCVARRAEALVLSAGDGLPAGAGRAAAAGPATGSRLANVTYRESWPPLGGSLIVTIFDEIAEGGRRRPCDIRIRCEAARMAPLLSCIVKVLSHVLREGSSEMLETVLSDLEQITESEGAWVRGRQVRSLPGLVAAVVRGHLAAGDAQPSGAVPAGA